jgi:hypothetical protein
VGEFSSNEKIVAPPEQRKALLERAAAMEGALEALLVKLAMERKTDGQDRRVLACFREGLQCLRESIEKEVSLRTRGEGSTPREWAAQGGTDGGPGQAYAAFKDLAGRVALIATSTPERSLSRDPDETGRAVREVTTSAKYRYCWWEGFPHDKAPTDGRLTKDSPQSN